MLAARLAESGVEAVLVERGERPGLGVAYSTPFVSHLLNVRSGRMSARADQPRDFVEWLERRHPDLADPEGFAPRRVYGEYVRARLATVQAQHADRLQIVRGEAVGVDEDGVILAEGSRLAARAVPDAVVGHGIHIGLSEDESQAVTRMTRISPASSHAPSRRDHCRRGSPPGGRPLARRAGA